MSVIHHTEDDPSYVKEGLACREKLSETRPLQRIGKIQAGSYRGRKCERTLDKGWDCASKGKNDLRVFFGNLVLNIPA